MQSSRKDRHHSAVDSMTLPKPVKEVCCRKGKPTTMKVSANLKRIIFTTVARLYLATTAKERDNFKDVSLSFMYYYNICIGSKLKQEKVGV